MNSKEKNNNRFLEALQDKFDNEEQKKGCKETLMFLMRKGFIKDKEVKRYLVCKEYPKYLEAAGGKKTNAVLQLSYYLDTTYSNVWRIVSDNYHLIGRL